MKEVLEEEKERYGVWEAEYREQVRQHAHTIVALEQRWVQSRQRAQEVEEERDALIGQLRGEGGGGVQRSGLSGCLAVWLSGRLAVLPSGWSCSSRRTLEAWGKKMASGYRASLCFNNK